MQKLTRALLILTILGVSAAPAGAQAFANAATARSHYTAADAMPAMTCADLASFKGTDIVSIQSRVVAATADTPQHCRVLGTIAPEVAFEVDLPDHWNRRFYMTGNGGLAGDALDVPNNPDRAGALTNGFVLARTNTGHDARKEPSGSFVMSNPQKAIDYAYRAVHVTADTAKQIARAYYGTPVTHSYWNSCSNGGRQGLLEAERYPQDFDGVVANAPWVDQTGFTIGALWNQRALTDAPVPLAKLPLVAGHVMAKCDALDGLKDGLIDDPRVCRFDPAKDVPACAAGEDRPDCLTTAQAATLTKIYDGPSSRGRSLFPGYMYGSEAVVPGPNGPSSTWAGLIVPARTDANPADFALADGIMKYLVFTPPRPDYDFRTFDFDRDPALLDRWGAIANATSTDLSAFKNKGGKLIMTYGWADQILQPLAGVHYYEQVTAKYGRSTAGFARLFMVPGMSHCAGGVGPDRNDAVSAVIDWVETGTAPTEIVASKVTNGTVVRTRPLCPYPQVARYTGSGSIDDAKNFRCVAPPPAR